MFKKIRQIAASTRGFTLIELLVVITIIGIMAVIAIPGFLSGMRRSALNTKVSAVVSLLEEARTQALASKLGTDLKIPSGGYGVVIDSTTSTATLFVDDYNAAAARAVNLDYSNANIVNRVVPDGVFSAGDTKLKTIKLNDPSYLQLGDLTGTLTTGGTWTGASGSSLVVIFRPPYAETTIRGISGGAPAELSELTAQIRLGTENLARRIKLHRVTTTSQVLRN